MNIRVATTKLKFGLLIGDTFSHENRFVAEASVHSQQNA